MTFRPLPCLTMLVGKLNLHDTCFVTYLSAVSSLHSGRLHAFSAPTIQMLQRALAKPSGPDAVAESG